MRMRASKKVLMVELAQAMLSNATIASRLGIRPQTVRIKLSQARWDGSEIAVNRERIAHEEAQRGLRIQPLSLIEIERLEKAAKARNVSAAVLLNRVIRELVSPESFPALIDNILDDGKTSSP